MGLQGSGRRRVDRVPWFGDRIGSKRVGLGIV